MVLEASTVSALAQIGDGLYGKGFLRLEQINGQYMLIGDGIVNVDYFVRRFTRIDTKLAVLSPADTFSLYTAIKSLVDYYALSLSDSKFSNELLINPTKKGMEVYAYIKDRVELISRLEFFSSESSFMIWLLKVLGKIE